MADGTVPEQLAADPIRPLTVVGLLRRRFLAILIPTLLVPGAALALTLQQEKQYEASTTLLFRDSGLGSTALASADPDREAATNLRLLQLDALKRRVNADRNHPFPGDVDVVTEAESNYLNRRNSSDRMQAELETIPQAYDLVVLDTPPATVVSDVIPMFDSVGGVVSSAGMTHIRVGHRAPRAARESRRPVPWGGRQPDLTNVIAARYSYAATTG